MKKTKSKADAGTKLTTRQLQSMRAAIKVEIQKYHHCLTLLPNLPAEVVAAVLDLFASEAAVALWLCESIRDLGDEIPMQMAQTPAGAKKVAQTLRAIADGAVL